jgi:hypothetical protein
MSRAVASHATVREADPAGRRARHLTLLTLLIGTLVACLLAVPAWAGEELRAPASGSPRPDFLFGRPKAWLGVRATWLVPRAQGDFFEFMTDQLTLERGDFRLKGFSFELGAPLTGRLDLVGGVDVAGRRIQSEFRRFVTADRQPIAQQTQYQQVDLRIGARLPLVSPGRSVSRYAFVPRRVVPSVGVGLLATRHDFQQFGQFVDFVDLSIFDDHFQSTGWTTGTYVQGTVDVWLWRRVQAVVEARYAWARATLSSDFSGFDGIDLAGFRTLMGVNLVF